MSVTTSLPIIWVPRSHQLTLEDIVNLVNRRAIPQSADGYPLRLAFTGVVGGTEVTAFEDEFGTPTFGASWNLAPDQLPSDGYPAKRWDIDGSELRTVFKQGTLMESGDRVQDAMGTTFTVEDASPQMEFGRVTSVICTLRAVNDPRRSRPMVYSIDETIEVIIHPDNS